LHCNVKSATMCTVPRNAYCTDLLERFSAPRSAAQLPGSCHLEHACPSCLIGPHGDVSECMEWPYVHRVICLLWLGVRQFAPEPDKATAEGHCSTRQLMRVRGWLQEAGRLQGHGSSLQDAGGSVHASNTVHIHAPTHENVLGERLNAECWWVRVGVARMASRAPVTTVPTSISILSSRSVQLFGTW
jgi:hypothetical protein